MLLGVPTVVVTGAAMLGALGIGIASNDEPDAGNAGMAIACGVGSVVLPDGVLATVLDGSVTGAGDCAETADAVATIETKNT